MNAMTTERPANPVAIFRHQLDEMAEQFKAALPAHVPVERFARVLMTAIQQNPELLDVERRSLWNAAMRAAQDGLLPDGREGAMVVRLDPRRGKTANWQPMIAGIRKKVRNSGEIATWDAHVVCEGDAFHFQLGDAPAIEHSYDLKTERGKIVGAYSVATLKDGEKSYEVMSIAEIHKIRDRADAWKAFKAGKIKSTPWADYEDEMCRKTVARRHSKVLPMSTDLDDLIRRDDDLYDMKGAREEAHADHPKSLAGKLDALAHMPEPETVDQETGEITTADAKGAPAPAEPAAATDAPASAEPAQQPAAGQDGPSKNDTPEEARRRGIDAFKAGERKKVPAAYLKTPLSLEFQDGWDAEAAEASGEAADA